MRGNTPKPFDMAQAVYLVAMWTVILFLSITAAQAGQVSLAWNASSGATGYQVHYGTSNNDYPNSMNVGNTTTYTVTDLADGATYYFAVLAYDGSGNESGFSNEVSATPAAVTPAPVANFSATPLSGAAPLTVKFTDQSTGSVTGWCWKFGITTTGTCDSEVQNPALFISPTRTQRSAGGWVRGDLAGSPKFPTLGSANLPRVGKDVRRSCQDRF